jgi:hypothetical protein
MYVPVKGCQIPLNHDDGRGRLLQTDTRNLLAIEMVRQH